jgi:hypothetical protein
LADYSFRDLSPGPDDKLSDDEDPPIEDEGELYCTAIVRYGSVCSRDDARKEVVVALKDEIRAYPDPDGNSDDQFFESAKVLDRWPEKPGGGLAGATPSPPQGDAVRKRRGGRPAHWVGQLRKYLRIRQDRGDPIHFMRLSELRQDFSRYAMQHRIPKVPTARSNLENQIKKVRAELVAKQQEREQRDPDTAPSIDEITRSPEIRSK